MVAPPRAYNKSKSPEVLDQDVDEDNFDDEETIDEFIKKHLDEDKKTQRQISTTVISTISLVQTTPLSLQWTNLA